MVFRESGNKELITNIDQLDVIKKFCNGLNDAKLERMIEELQDMKGLFYHNVQFKLIFTALAFRYGSLMRGSEPLITSETAWKHLPAFSET